MTWTNLAVGETYFYWTFRANHPKYRLQGIRIEEWEKIGCLLLDYITAHIDLIFALGDPLIQRGFKQRKGNETMPLNGKIIAGIVKIKKLIWSLKCVWDNYVRHFVSMRFGQPLHQPHLRSLLDGSPFDSISECDAHRWGSIHWTLHMRNFEALRIKMAFDEGMLLVQDVECR